MRASYKRNQSVNAWLDCRAVLLFRTRRYQRNLREAYALHLAFLSNAVSVIQMASRMPFFFSLCSLTIPLPLILTFLAFVTCIFFFFSSYVRQYSGLCIPYTVPITPISLPPILQYVTSEILQWGRHRSWVKTHERRLRVMNKVVATE